MNEFTAAFGAKIFFLLDRFRRPEILFIIDFIVLKFCCHRDFSSKRSKDIREDTRGANFAY